MLGGVAKSLGTGLVQGVTGTLGMPADLYHWYEGDTGPNPYGSAALTKDVEQYTGPLHQPQGVLENTVSKIGQFAPALIGGPETLAAKLATRVIAPAIGTEIAEKATQGTPYQPYAEVAGALVGGAGASAAARRFQAMAAARNATNAIPSTDQIMTTAGNQFNAARNMNLVVKPDFATNAAADMRSALQGFDPVAQAPVFAAADRLENLGASPGPGLPQTAVPMNDVENIRKQLTNLKMSPDGATRQAAKTALQSLQNSQTALTPADVLSGNASAYTNTMQNAIGNYAAGKRSMTVQGKAALGDLNAATAGSGANQDNATRQAIKQLARPINNTNTPQWQKLGFNAQEGAAINQAARGTVTGNVARYLGKAAPTGVVSLGMDVMGGHMLGGPIAAVSIPTVGYLAKKIGDLSTARAVQALDSLVRSRSPLAAQVAAQLPPQIVRQISPQSQLLLRSAALSLGPAIQPPNQNLGRQISQAPAQ